LFRSVHLQYGRSVGPDNTFSDLYLGDLIFASAITVEELLAPQRELRSAQVPALCALLGRGYFDRSGSEPRNDQEERAIRYAASVGGYLLDFAAGTAAQVRRLHILLD